MRYVGGIREARRERSKCENGGEQRVLSATRRQNENAVFV
jgi:hypothetical protein